MINRAKVHRKATNFLKLAGLPTVLGCITRQNWPLPSGIHGRNLLGERPARMKHDAGGQKLIYSEEPFRGIREIGKARLSAVKQDFAIPRLCKGMN